MRLLLLLLCLGITSYAFSQKIKPKKVLNYYNLYTFAQEYPIQAVKKKYQTVSRMTQHPLPVTVNKGKGFIEILDKAADNSTTKIQFVLYQKKDKGAVFVTLREVFDGFAYTNDLQFWEYKKSWKNVTAQVMPKEVAINRFFISKEVEKITPEQRKAFFSLSYQLPKNGTTIEMILNTKVFEMLCEGKLKDEMSRRKLIELCEHPPVFPKLVSLFWKKDTGKFSYE